MLIDTNHVRWHTIFLTILNSCSQNIEFLKIIHVSRNNTRFMLCCWIYGEIYGKCKIYYNKHSMHNKSRSTQVLLPMIYIKCIGSQQKYSFGTKLLSIIFSIQILGMVHRNMNNAFNCLCDTHVVILYLLMKHWLSGNFQYFLWYLQMVEDALVRINYIKTEKMKKISNFTEIQFLSTDSNVFPQNISVGSNINWKSNHIACIRHQTWKMCWECVSYTAITHKCSSCQFTITLHSLITP